MNGLGLDQAQNGKTAFEEWFEVTNKNHLESLAHYLDSKQSDRWPKHFIPADVSFTEDSVELVLIKIAHAWIERLTKTAVRCV